MNSSGENARKSKRPLADVSRERITYEVMASAGPTASSTSPQSARPAPSVAPWIMKAVLAKSGKNVNPLRLIFAPAAAFNSHVRVTGERGKTPGPNCGSISHFAFSTRKKQTTWEIVYEAFAAKLVSSICRMELPAYQCAWLMLQDRELSCYANFLRHATWQTNIQQRRAKDA